MAQDFLETYNKLRVKMFYGTVAIYFIRFVIVLILNVNQGVSDVFISNAIVVIVLLINFYYLFANNKRIKPATLVLVYTITLNIFITGIFAGYGEHGDVKVVRDLITLNIMVLITAFMVGRKHAMALTLFLIASYFIMAFVFEIDLFKEFLVFLILFTCAALFIYSLLANIIEKTVRATIEANIEIEQLNKFKHNITRLVFHDLKVPVNSIINLNKDGNTSNSEKTVFYANFIKKQLENVLDVERFEEAEMKLELTDVQISELINQAILAIEVLANQKNISIETKISPDGVLCCDKNLIERVIINLLSNAIKYSSLNKKIRIEVENSNGLCIIKVEDEGIGIDFEHHVKIFNKYYMVNTDNSISATSTGLGLTFCKLAVTAHHGNIDVISNKNSGSVFIVKLPGFRLQKSEEICQFFSNAELVFEQHEIIQLSSICEKIKDIPIFRIGEIFPLIKPFEENENPKIKIWVQKLSDAVYNGNCEYFNQLIKSVLDNNYNE